MQAKETKLQEIIEGTNQFIVPLFQRTYSWNKKEWEILWNDLVELCEMEKPRTHFIGSIVSMPTISVPEGVAKYLLIDGQQRLTTIFIILILLRNLSRKKNKNDFADEINNTLLVNPYKKDSDIFKLLPTQNDRQSYINLINETSFIDDNKLTSAYEFFERKFRQKSIEIETIKKIITNYFSIVSIVLDADDNPYLVFESLNAKGRPLTQADLIRNYFFMRIHVDDQQKVYKEMWKPMQDDLGESLTEFIRHYLMKDGEQIKRDDVYYSLKAVVNQNNCIDYLKILNKFSKYYKNLLSPNFERNLEIQENLKRLNRIEVTTAYPLLLNFYQYYSESKLSGEDFLEVLKSLENYLIRRFVCGYPTNQLNKIFPRISSQLFSKPSENLKEDFNNLLQINGYPKDSEFKTRLKDGKLYGSGDRTIKTRLILETLEESFDHKENKYC